MFRDDQDINTIPMKKFHDPLSDHAISCDNVLEDNCIISTDLLSTYEEHIRKHRYANFVVKTKHKDVNASYHTENLDERRQKKKLQERVVSSDLLRHIRANRHARMRKCIHHDRRTHVYVSTSIYF